MATIVPGSARLARRGRIGDREAVTTAQRMVDAAGAWLADLDGQQRVLAAWPWPSDDERHRWHYTPTDHGGLPLGLMRPRQQSKALQLVATGLSSAGYGTVCTIMALENVLDAVEGWPPGGDRERRRDPGLYYLRVFGEPGGTGPWSWRFGGHHVSVHHLIVDGAVVASTPCFLGANPASSPLLGPHPLRPLAGVEDLARDLVRSFDEEQAASAVLSGVAPADIVSGNRPRVGSLIGTGGTALTAAPKGLPAQELTPAQQDVLRALLGAYLGRIPQELAEREAAKVAGERLGTVHFAWAGAIAPGQPHYYRLQGPRLLVEYDNTQNDANHVHSVWRDPEGDFGFDVLAHHRATHH